MEEKHQEVINVYYDNLIKAEEKVINDVLRHCLQREPVLPEDYKRLTIATREGQETKYAYELGFDGSLIGYVYRDIEYTKVSVRFEPYIPST